MKWVWLGLFAWGVLEIVYSILYYGLMEIGVAIVITAFFWGRYDHMRKEEHRVDHPERAATYLPAAEQAPELLPEAGHTRRRVHRKHRGVR